MKIIHLAALAAFVALGCGQAYAQSTLRVGLAEDPDVLDPSLARTYVGRIVFASFCDKLFDIDAKLNVVPQLALSHETSEDGKCWDAVEKDFQMPKYATLPGYQAGLGFVARRYCGLWGRGT